MSRRLLVPVLFLIAFGCPIAAQTQPTTPVPILTTATPDIFPDYWRTKEIDAKAVPLAPSEVERSLRMARRALAKYPESVLKKHLAKVCLVRSMTFYGLPYGGTNSGDAVYLCNDGVRLGFTDDYLEASLHHELSSILLRNLSRSFPERAWNDANPPGFTYGSGGVEALRQHQDSIVYDPKLYASGFLTQYSKASQEEDFNTVAEGLFMGRKAFWAAIDGSPRLKKKCDAAISFYQSIDAQFTEKWFRSLPGVGSELAMAPTRPSLTIGGLSLGVGGFGWVPTCGLSDWPHGYEQGGCCKTTRLLQNNPEGVREGSRGLSASDTPGFAPSTRRAPWRGARTGMARFSAVS